MNNCRFSIGHHSHQCPTLIHRYLTASLLPPAGVRGEAEALRAGNGGASSELRITHAAGLSEGPARPAAPAAAGLPAADGEEEAAGGLRAPPAGARAAGGALRRLREGEDPAGTTPRGDQVGGEWQAQKGTEGQKVKSKEGSEVKWTGI